MSENTARSVPAATQQRKVSVIQCPACNTKFAVETATVANIEDPRFHCSRCDNVFELNIRAISEEAYKDLQKIKEKPIHNPVQPSQDSFVFEFTDVEVEEKEDRILARGEDENGHKFEVSVGSGELQDSISDELAPISDHEIGDDLFLGLDAKSSESSWIKTKASPSEEPMGYETLSRFTLGDPSSINSVIENEIKKSWIPSLNISSNHPVLLFSIPCIFLILLFTTIAVFSSFWPSSVLNVSEYIIGDKFEKFPKDLFVTQSSYKQLILDSGETVSVIQGKLTNKSNSIVTDILLEGAIFDKYGDIIQKKKAHAASSLNKSRMQSLSLRMVEDLQNSLPAHTLKLKSGQSSEFTIVVPQTTSLTAKKPNFYLVRVYSGKSELS